MSGPLQSGYLARKPEFFFLFWLKESTKYNYVLEGVRRESRRGQGEKGDRALWRRNMGRRRRGENSATNSLPLGDKRL